MKKILGSKPFKAFIVMYVLFLIMHSVSLDWNSWLVRIALCCGILVARMAHTRYGLLTIGLLLVHMSLEWTEHARHGWHYSMGEIVMHVIHAFLDFIFLYHELGTHVAKFKHWTFATITCGLVFLFAVFHESAPRNLRLLAIMNQRGTLPVHHDHGRGPFEPFVMGGMFGCIFSHLFRRRHYQ